jgi:hypothetical protein
MWQAPIDLSSGSRGASGPQVALDGQGDGISVWAGGAGIEGAGYAGAGPRLGSLSIPASPCTFIVTFAHASRAIPISATSFTLIDGRGHIHHPSVSSIDGGVAPRRVVPGHATSLRIHDVLPTGNGALLFQPYGGRPIVSWDYDVEID